MRKYYIQYSIGSSRYIVNFHDGLKHHSDGSLFFDIAVFKNKKSLGLFVKTLENQGYMPT